MTQPTPQWLLWPLQSPSYWISILHLYTLPILYSILSLYSTLYFSYSLLFTFPIRCSRLCSPLPCLMSSLHLSLSLSLSPLLLFPLTDPCCSSPLSSSSSLLLSLLLLFSSLYSRSVQVRSLPRVHPRDCQKPGHCRPHPEGWNCPQVPFLHHLDAGRSPPMGTWPPLPAAPPSVTALIFPLSCS